NQVRFTFSGPTSDFGGTSPPFVTATAVGGGASGSLTGPDGAGGDTDTPSAPPPDAAAETWRLGVGAGRKLPVKGENLTEPVQNPVLDFSVDGSAVVARRTVVTQDNCSGCHGTFSTDFSVHGGSRNRVEYCVICHNPSVTDFDRRKNAIASGADSTNETIAFKPTPHGIHRGEDLQPQPYIVYGCGSAPKNYPAHDFGEIRYPGDLRACEKCYMPGTQFVPLPAGVMPTVESVVNSGSEQ